MNIKGISITMIIKKMSYKSSIRLAFPLIIRSLIVNLAVFVLLNSTCFSQEVAPPMEQIDIKESAKVLYNTNNKKESLNLLLKIPRKEQTEETYLMISNIFSDMGNAKSAITFLQRALIINPNSFRAYYNLGVIYQKKNDLPSAIENYKKAISKNRSFAYSYYNLGCVYLEQKNFKAAKPNFIRAINSKPDDKDFYYNLAYTYKMLGDEKNAQKILDVYNKF